MIIGRWKKAPSSSKVTLKDQIVVMIHNLEAKEERPTHTKKVRSRKANTCFEIENRQFVDMR